MTFADTLDEQRRDQLKHGRVPTVCDLPGNCADTIQQVSDRLDEIATGAATSGLYYWSGSTDERGGALDLLPGECPHGCGGSLVAGGVAGEVSE